MYRPFCIIKALRGQKEIKMDNVNSNPVKTESAQAAVPAPAAVVPEMAAATIVNATPAVTPAPAPAAAPAPAVNPAPAAAPVVKGELPKTTGSTPGGWNRFAGY